MLKQPLFLFSFILIIIIALLHIVALEFHLYWLFWWFDMLTHFLGGLWVSLISIWFVFFSGIESFKLVRNKKNVFFTAIISVIIIGVLWEAFEFFSDFPTEINYYKDTAIDIVMDIFGSLVGFLYAIKILKSTNSQNDRR